MGSAQKRTGSQPGLWSMRGLPFVQPSKAMSSAARGIALRCETIISHRWLILQEFEIGKHLLAQVVARVAETHNHILRLTDEGQLGSFILILHFDSPPLCFSFLLER